MILPIVTEFTFTIATDSGKIGSHSGKVQPKQIALVKKEIQSTNRCEMLILSPMRRRMSGIYTLWCPPFYFVTRCWPHKCELTRNPCSKISNTEQVKCLARMQYVGCIRFTVIFVQYYFQVLSSHAAKNESVLITRSNRCVQLLVRCSFPDGIQVFDFHAILYGFLNICCCQCGFAFKCRSNPCSEIQFFIQ